MPYDEVITRATLPAHSGAIILMHERLHILKALAKIIKFYQEKQYRFVTVFQLQNVNTRHNAYNINEHN